MMVPCRNARHTNLAQNPNATAIPRHTRTVVRSAVKRYSVTDVVRLRLLYDLLAVAICNSYVLPQRCKLWCPAERSPRYLSKAGVTRPSQSFSQVQLALLLNAIVRPVELFAPPPCQGVKPELSLQSFLAIAGRSVADTLCSASLSAISSPLRCQTPDAPQQ